MDMKRFGRMVYRLRREKGITSEQTGVGCGCNPVFIRKIESGSRLPSLPMFVLLCNALGVAPHLMLSEELTLPPEALSPYDELADAARGLTPQQLLTAAQISKNIASMESEAAAHIAQAVESMCDMDAEQLGMLAKMIEGMARK